MNCSSIFLTSASARLGVGGSSVFALAACCAAICAARVGSVAIGRLFVSGGLAHEHGGPENSRKD